MPFVNLIKVWVINFENIMKLREEKVAVCEQGQHLKMLNAYEFLLDETPEDGRVEPDLSDKIVERTFS